MKEIIKGYVVVNDNHPSNPKTEVIYHDSFEQLRKDSIATFMGHSNLGWEKMKKMNFRCVKATMAIVTDDHVEGDHLVAEPVSTEADGDIFNPPLPLNAKAPSLRAIWDRVGEWLFGTKQS